MRRCKLVAVDPRIALTHSCVTHYLTLQTLVSEIALQLRTWPLWPGSRAWSRGLYVRVQWIVAAVLWPCNCPELYGNLSMLCFRYYNMYLSGSSGSSALVVVSRSSGHGFQIEYNSQGFPTKRWGLYRNSIRVELVQHRRNTNEIRRPPNSGPQVFKGPQARRTILQSRPCI